MKRILGISVAAVVAWVLPLLLSAQMQSIPKEGEDEQKYVRLMSAQSVKLLEREGKSYRLAEGPARFLHNNTWLICDSALWDVEGQIIHAMGHVSIEQENTELTSDSLTYFVERNVAEFRGSMVQLMDKENNILRSHDLDYNTKDSVATFRGGGAMRDKDGQLIESVYGQYEAVCRLFTFERDVNMFTDSVFIKTSSLTYNSNNTIATFPSYVEAWKDDKMISATNGWYNRSKELFFFTTDVHMMSQTQEGWCDTLYYNRGDRTMKMTGNAQALDSKRKVSSAAGLITYVDSTSTIRLLDDPVVMMEVDQKKDSLTTQRDSVYFRADSIRYWAIKRCEIDSAYFRTAKERLETIMDDPVRNIRIKAAEEAAKKAAEAAKNDPNRPPEMAKTAKPEPEPELEPPVSEPEQSLVSPSDSLSQNDSLAVSPADTLAAVTEKDSTKIGFLKAGGSVRIFRKSMQVACDSLWYWDIDSLARLYKDPIIWNEGRHQYQADSIWAVVKNNKMDKANLMSSAFIMINENDVLFDQIRSAEMAAFFDEDSQLRRFDAMGDASALFYIKEKEKLSTANKKEAGVLSAEFYKGEIQGITYYEQPKSDVYPIAQMKPSDKILKGFNWRPELRPKSPADITSRTFRASQRAIYSDRPRATFKRTARYFPGYIEKVYREIARADSLRKARAELGDTVAVVDTVALPIDSLSLMLPDSLGYIEIDDHVEIFGATQVKSDFSKPDTTAAATPAVKTKAELRAEERERKKALWEKKRAEKMAAREKRWEELDRRDAEKLARKQARKQAREEALQAKRIERYKARKAKEDAIREKYKHLYQTKWKNKLLRSISIGSGEPSSF